MPPDDDERAPREVIEAERTAYLENLPEPGSDWPPDVRAVYETLRERLFEWGG